MENFSTVQLVCAAIIPVLFAITLHEVAHGWIADMLGDPTARQAGRLSINPLQHISWIGSVLVPFCMFLSTPYLFGWAKPVPINGQRLRSPLRDMALVAMAGPGANLLMAIFWVVFLLIMRHALAPAALLQFAMLMGEIGIYINILLLVINLLPVPPLDGSRVVYFLLPSRWRQYYQLLELWGFVILVLLLVSGVLEKILTPPFMWLQDLAYAFL